MSAVLAASLLGGIGQAALALPVPAAAPAQAPPADAAEDGDGEAASETAGLAEAARTGQPVEVLSLRGESSDVFALPDGSLEAHQYLRPVRAREDGRWRDIDTGLAVQADGTVAPAVTTVELAFSGGGVEDPLVSMTRAGRTLQLDWPGPLPAPELDGADAVYREVLTDVDLRMGAEPEGFTQLLVVHTAEAAHSQELTELTLGLRAEGMAVEVTAAGGLRAIDQGAGGAVFEAATPLVWDSSTGDDGSGEEAAARRAAAGDGPGAGDSGSQGQVGVEVTEDGLTLTPDPAVLRGEDTEYPVYVDPQWHSPRAQAWTMASRYWHDSPQWRFNDEDNAGLGYCGWDYCMPHDLKRLFYRIPVDDFGGTDVLRAEFVVPNVFSASCTAREVQLWRTRDISAATTWDTQNDSAFWIDRLDSRSFAHGHEGCAAGDAEFDVRAAVQQAADANRDTLTFGMRATSEDDRLGWKRFSDNAHLRVRYNRPPPQIRMDQLLMRFGGQCEGPSHAPQVRSRGLIHAIDVTDPDRDDIAVQFRAFWDSGDGRGNVVRWGPE